MHAIDHLSPEDLARITYTWERIRSLLTGFLEVIWQPGASVALLVAIRYFDADVFSKGIISAANFLGFLFAPVSLSLFARTGRPITRIMAFLYCSTAALLFAASFASQLVPYVLLMAFAHILLMQHLPMNTEMYGNHFTTHQRGHRISTVFLIAGSVSAIASVMVGRFLDIDLQSFRLIYRGAACCAVGIALCLIQIPSRPLELSKVGHPLRNIGLIKRDPLFAWMLLSWMLLGFGNLMTLPLRVEYMANPDFGIDATNQTILLITGVVPLLARLMMTRVLGKLFDRVNLVTLRMALNLVLLVSMLCFFSTSNLWVMTLGMALLGSGMAGGRILWTLWVTKLAPPDQTSAYMSVHMMSTGIRGSIAPFVGYLLISQMPILQVAVIGSVLTLISTVMFFPARKHMTRRGQVLT
jgi:MFS family permease